MVASVLRFDLLVTGIVAVLIFSHIVDCDNYHYSTDGLPCKDECGMRDEEYYWCHVENWAGWDYCSPRPDVTYKGDRCTRPCGKHGTEKYFCYTSLFSWAKCGIVEPKDVFYRSATYGAVCINKCRYHERSLGRSGYYCDTAQGWDKCSPERGKTYKNQDCYDQCSSKGEDYTWCWRSRFTRSWCYCGDVWKDDCSDREAVGLKRRKRARDQQPEESEVCHVSDTSHGISTRLLFRPNTRIATTENRREIREIEEIISRWTNDRLSTAAGTLIRTENYRIDMQGMFARDGQTYYNLQIQRNGQSTASSTTFAHAEVPFALPVGAQQLPDRYVRRAFRESRILGGVVAIVVGSTRRSRELRQQYVELLPAVDAADLTRNVSASEVPPDDMLVAQ